MLFDFYQCEILSIVEIAFNKYMFTLCAFSAVCLAPHLRKSITVGRGRSEPRHRNKGVAKGMKVQ
jgi:hypothetical protein